MPFVLCYHKPGLGTYPDHNYPGHTALNCDWEHALHLALSEDGAAFTPLRNNTGILFAEAAYDEGDPRGVTKVLTDPRLCRRKDNGFLLCVLRRNQNAPDSRDPGCVLLYESDDLVFYRKRGFLKLADGEIRHPDCTWSERDDAWRFTWESEDGTRWSCLSRDLATVTDIVPAAPAGQAGPLPDYGIDGCIPGNVIEITDAEALVLRRFLGVIENTGVLPVRHTQNAGSAPTALPGAVCVYSDGSTHEKPVEWDLGGVDFSRPGTYTVSGRVRVKKWPFPLPLSFGSYPAGEINDPNMDTGMSDPCVTLFRGRYYLSSSGNQNIVLRCADTVEGVFSAEPKVIFRVPLGPGEKMAGTWAAELHEIDGVGYLFTTVCPGGDWTLVKSVVLRLKGDDPLAEGAWEAPVWCRKPDGSLLTEGGISLDMTWFRDNGRDYVMWSDRIIRYGTDPLIIEPANIFIATVDPKQPWQCTSDPVCILRPLYGWDRYETEVDEAPYLLRRGDDLFVTISGSSTGMADLYDVGLLRAKSGVDLLDPASWTWLPYPLLTKESVPGQFGPGHNNFVKDPETGDDLMVYHAVPHDAAGHTLRRRPAIRRVHWAATGLPYLEMTPERDLKPGLENVTMTLTLL